MFSQNDTNKVFVYFSSNTSRQFKFLLNKSNKYFYLFVCICGCASGHRDCFNEENWGKSALSMHAMDMHPNQFSLENFIVSLVKRLSPQQIRREFRFIEKFKTLPFGLNRYNV